MPRIDLKTLENGLGGRDRLDFGTARCTAQNCEAFDFPTFVATERPSKLRLDRCLKVRPVVVRECKPSKIILTVQIDG